MSVKASTWVWENSAATGNAFVVLLAIAEAANSDGENSCQSVARLTRMARCSESTVHRAITQLLATGEIEKTGVNVRYFNTNVYRLPGVSGGVSGGGVNLTPPVIEAPEGVSPVTPEPRTNPTTSRTSSEGEVETSTTGNYPGPQTAPSQHPSRQIAGWQPDVTFVRYLTNRYRHVRVGDAVTRFTNFHIARQDTSKSWEALLENWVSSDDEKIGRLLEGGTDDLGVPRHQSGSSVVPPPLQPGDEGYFDPTAG